MGVGGQKVGGAGGEGKNEIGEERGKRESELGGEMGKGEKGKCLVNSGAEMGREGKG